VRALSWGKLLVLGCCWRCWWGLLGRLGLLDAQVVQWQTFEDGVVVVVWVQLLVVAVLLRVQV
jgi:hypothetical protein